MALILSHEALHVVCETFDVCAIPIDGDNQETAAYFEGYVTSCLFDFINQIKVEKEDEGYSILCP